MDCYQCGKPVDGRGFEVTDVGPMHPACYRRLINDKQTIATLRAEVEGLREQYAEAIDDLRAVNAHRAVIEKHEKALQSKEQR